MDLETLDNDTLFAQLEALVAKLEEMQEKDRRLTQAREAREVREAAQRLEELEQELAQYQQVKEKALGDIKCSLDSKKEAGEAEMEQVGIVHVYTDLYASRLSSVQRAQAILDKLLEETNLSPQEDLDEYAMSEDAFQALEAELKNYQQQYLATYEECQKRLV